MNKNIWCLLFTLITDLIALTWIKKLNQPCLNGRYYAVVFLYQEEEFIFAYFRNENILVIAPVRLFLNKISRQTTAHL